MAEKKRAKIVSKMFAQNAQKREIIKEKINGERFAYMGDPSFHWGTGGYIRGHMNLFYGPSKSGKTTIFLKYLGEEQKRSDGAVIIFDTEWSHVDPYEVDMKGNLSDGAIKTRERLEKAGLDIDNTVIWQTNIATDMFEWLNAIEDDLKADPNSISAILVDSWGGIQPEQARNKLEKGKADDAGKSFGGNAKTINPVLQHLVRIANVYGVTVFSVQHVMVNQEQYGPKYLLPGGQKLIHLHHMIAFLEASDTKNNSLLAGDIQGTSTMDMATKVGKLVRYRCEKSRNTVEGKSGEFFMNFEEMKFAKGEESLFNLAVRLGILVHPKNDKGGENKIWWQYPEVAETPFKWKGQQAVIDSMTADKSLYNEIWGACMSSKKMAATTEAIGNVAVEDEDGKLRSVSDVLAEAE